MLKVDNIIPLWRACSSNMIKLFYPILLALDSLSGIQTLDIENGSYSCDGVFLMQ